jgi:hypothetical protein
MSTRLTTSLFCLLCVSFAPQERLYALSNPLSFKKVSSLFAGKQPYEEVIQKEYTLGKKPTIDLEAHTGLIQVRAGTGAKVTIQATKKASSKENLANMHLLAQKTDANTLTIKTVVADQSISGNIDYLLTIPEKATIKITAQEGTIKIRKTAGAVTASVDSGSIEAYDTYGALEVTTKTNGAIVAQNTHGNIIATTLTGNITIENSYQDVIAQTKKGRICARCKKIPASSTISIASTTGNVNLALPEGTNANLKAQTGQGNLTCSHYVTLNPLTTQLNHEAWNRFKKEVDGILGTGDATIKVVTGHGNIRITDLDEA